MRRRSPPAARRRRRSRSGEGQVELARSPVAPPRLAAHAAPAAQSPRRRHCSAAPSMTWNSGCRASRPRRVELLDQPLERHVLVRRTPPGRSRGPGSAARGSVGSPDRSVRSTRVLTKNPTRSSSASSVRPATGDADRDVRAAPSRDSSTASAACSTMNRRGPGVAGQLGKARVQRPRRTAEGARHRRGGWRTPGRGRSVGSSSSSGSAGQLLSPVASCRRATLSGSSARRRAARAATARSPRTAPAAAAHVRRPPAAPRRVGGHEVAQQRRHRPAVAGDVVHHQQQHVLVAGRARTASRRSAAARRPGRSAWSAARRSAASSRVGGHARRSRQVEPASAMPGSAGSGSPSASGKTVRSASCRATTSRKRAASACAVQRAPQAEHARDVVGRAGAVQLVQEPQPALGERQRDHRSPRVSPDRSSGAARDGRTGPVASCAARPATVGASNTVRRSARHPGRPDPGDQPGGEQRVPAEVEEVVVDADRGQRRAPRRTAGTGPSPGAVRGARPVAARAVRRGRAGPCGRACRWGSAAARRAATNADGTMYSGSSLAAVPAQRVAVGQRRPPAGHRRRRPAACRRSSWADAPRPGDLRVRGQRRPRSRPARSGTRGSSPGRRPGRGTPAGRRRVHRTRSPVRYIRSPGPPNGSATNRSAVRPGRPR